MSSVYSRLVIEKYEDSYGIFIDDMDDNMGLTKEDALALFEEWLE
jgi:hypothetical protein